MMAKNNSNLKTISTNKRAYHDYFILESYEAGIELKGTEVKSLRQGTTSLNESYITVKGGEIFIIGWHIPPYEQGNIYNHDATRTRKLLLHKREIIKLAEKAKQDGLTIVPLSLYFKDSKIKLQIALARGKKLYDKREAKEKQDMDRAISQAERRYHKYN